LAPGRVLAAGMSEEDLRQLIEHVGEMRLASGQVVTQMELEQAL
jgi:hypothetical protein